MGDIQKVEKIFDTRKCFTYIANVESENPVKAKGNLLEVSTSSITSARKIYDFR